MREQETDDPGRFVVCQAQNIFETLQGMLIKLDCAHDQDVRGSQYESPPSAGLQEDIEQFIPRYRGCSHSRSRPLKECSSASIETTKSASPRL